MISIGAWFMSMGIAVIIGSIIARVTEYREIHREEREANDGLWPLTWRQWE